MKTEAITLRPDTSDVRQAIITRYLPPTNTRGSRIRATCDRGSVTVTFSQEGSLADAHAEAVCALLAKFAREDGQNRSFGEPAEYVCGGMPQDYYLQAAKMQGIRVDVTDGILSVMLPALLPKKTRTEGFKFLQPAIHAALKQYAEQQNLPHFCECTICIEHIYDRCLPIKAVRDYDNLEMKEVLDIIALYCMTDDTGALCDQFQTTRFADSSCTIISVMQKEKFSAWLDKKNP